MTRPDLVDVSSAPPPARDVDASGLTGDYMYRSATAFLMFALTGPFFGTFAFMSVTAIVASLFVDPALSSTLTGTRPAFENIGFVVFLTLIGAPVGYIIGFVPACVAGFLFLLLHAYGHVSHFKACALIVALEAILFVFIYFHPVKWGIIYRIERPADGVILFVTHAVPTIIATYLAWRVYSGRWWPRAQPEGAAA